MEDQKIVNLFGIIILSVVTIVISGWIFDIEILKSDVPNGQIMRSSSALSFICVGVAFLFITRMKQGKISINSRIENELVIVSITDNGIGIPKIKQENLFKRFYQVDKSLTRKSGGTGLGLAISRGIIESHGGKIWVESEEGQGARVSFSIFGANSN